MARFGQEFLTESIVVESASCLQRCEVSVETAEVSLLCKVDVPYSKAIARLIFAYSPAVVSPNVTAVIGVTPYLYGLTVSSYETLPYLLMPSPHAVDHLCQSNLTCPEVLRRRASCSLLRLQGDQRYDNRLSSMVIVHENDIPPLSAQSYVCSKYASCWR